jgi:hypothetical protein
MDSLNFDRAAAFYDATRALPERTVHETEIASRRGHSS